MGKMKKWVAGALCVAACAGLGLLLAPQAGDGSAVPDSGAPPAQASSSTEANRVQVDGTMYGQPLPASNAPWLGHPASATESAMASPLSTMSPPRFAADSRGRLVLDADTHANLEKLLLDENPETRRATLDKVSKNLPPQAAAELKVLLGQFQQYSKALAHTIAPEHAPETEQEGLKLLDSLHALRVSYFGLEGAQAMFGQEEATARQLIALMAAENNPHLTQQQKAERAQEILRNRQ